MPWVRRIGFKLSSFTISALQVKFLHYEAYRGFPILVMIVTLPLDGVSLTSRRLSLTNRAAQFSHCVSIRKNAHGQLKLFFRKGYPNILRYSHGGRINNSRCADLRPWIFCFVFLSPVPVSQLCQRSNEKTGQVGAYHRLEKSAQSTGPWDTTPNTTRGCLSTKFKLRAKAQHACPVPTQKM